MTVRRSLETNVARLASGDVKPASRGEVNLTTARGGLLIEAVVRIRVAGAWKPHAIPLSGSSVPSAVGDIQITRRGRHAGRTSVTRAAYGRGRRLSQIRTPT